jgi:deoxyribonuclease V
MILAVDVYYRANDAFTAGVLFDNWDDCEPINELVARISDVGIYTPGEFYRRELPCILALVNQLNELPNYIIIDGYVFLGENKKPGLGKYLFDALQGYTPVIGVAKTHFFNTPPETAIYRGKSKRALYITSIGLEEKLAKQYILKMCGENRIPILLKTVDQICRQVYRK